MSARYFQGTSVLGPVRASPARTFREVVDALRICPVLPLDHASFLALDEKQRNEAKQVPFFVPACFKHSPSKRIYDEATHCNLIFLDIDPEKEQRNGKWVETGRYPAAPFVNNPQLLHTALAEFNFAAHVTASSTPEKPRMRIIVDAERIPLEAYPSAALTIAALLGLPTVTKESKVAVQPMFLPVLFNDSSDDEHPVIAFHLDGRSFTPSDIGDQLLLTPHGKNGSNGANGHAPETDSSSDALEFLRAPVPEISLAATKEALFAIDSDCSRADWLNCAAALKHQFSPHRAEEAFELFDEWSETGKKYGGEDETRAAWKSLRPSPIGRLPVTIRTLFHKAKESGWNDKRVREDCFAVTMKWFEDAPTIMDIMEHGVKKILATPLLSSMQEDILIGALCTQAKRKFAQTISPTAVRKDLNRAKATMRATEEEPAEKAKEPPWAKDVCYIIGADEFYRHRTGEKIKQTAFNAAYGRFLLPSKKDLIASGTPLTPQSESTPMARPSEYALHKLKIPTVQDYAYDPAQPNDKFFVLHGTRLVNTYSPTYPQEDPKHAKLAGDLLQMHLRNLVAEPEYRRTLIDFMAFLVQAPGRKIRWAVLIQSVEGAGKTFLAEVMKAVLGPEHVKTIDGASIKSGWNEWAFGKQLVVLEEVKVSGTNKHEIMNSLKPLITNDDISVNERFRNNRQVQNISNYMIFSNHHDALALTPGDRRYFIIKSPLQSKAQVLALGDNYFAPLYAVLREHPGGMRSFLADWEISPDFRPDGHAPRTKYVQDMVNDSANDLTATIRRLLLEADYPLIQYDIVSAASLRTVLMELEGLTKVTAQQISQVLREEGLHQAGRHLIGDDRHYLWARMGISEEEAGATAIERHKKELKNLGMDLIY
jgi:hypothetical protein